MYRLEVMYQTGGFDVRFGSLADIAACFSDVPLPPKADVGYGAPDVG